MTKNIISLRSIDKDYFVGDITVRALKSINMEINEGEFTSVMGASGSGKSTLLNILGCLDKSTKGEYYLDNLLINSLTKNQLAYIRNQKIGFVFQSYNLLPKTTALENVELPLLYNKLVDSRERRERALKALDAVGLSDRKFHMPNQLSGGQQQRVAIARSLVNNPVLILADEPTGNLDTRTSYEIMALFQDLNTQGKTIVIVTHENDIAQFTSRNVVYRDGKIIQDEMVKNKKDALAELNNLPVDNNGVNKK
ncbi:MAG: ABC transporter ATP-binding protein [Bacteroidetes bacterium GWC2_33_15]|nr:MAG: ABC transporter ATP-binding protein [Bacteroidetes bacterium GWA2_33_15]OFX50936.1 MAG: ABC transporter ATP-binding protein [Bacteroidetes bacterium GWC2_33_15]OFX66559.1 MAG: ABC transporter ATP-binding protein [Bacteroidetes bacterium GWB2_32_14]OFX70162.1 MAG: ABC transporter ATP-binding protein [Bacteroidetes bacterium GWD2_33_33]HAN20027.1 ABC transporter ATP-binding protein [Bacteroidales bacterium]